MFTQACFIRKNTPELRKKLEDLGYNKSVFGSDLNNSIATTISNDKPSYTCIREQSFDDTNPHTTWGFKFRIDCDDNEELFLALAALRDDSDYMQWFIHDVTKTKRLHGCFGQVIGMDGNYTEVVRREWILHEENNNQISDFIKHTKSFGDEPYVRKATVEEIVGHFKTK